MHEIVDYLKEVDKFLRSLGGIPYSFRDPIEKWISERNQWIMYAAPECKTKEQATSAPLPNIWIGDPSEDGKEVRMGLSFQTKTLVETFMSLNEVPNRETRDKMLTILSKISKDWVFTIQQKTRWDTFATSSHYKEIEAIPCAEIDSAKLTQIIKTLQKIKAESHKRDDIVDGRRIDYQGPAFNFMEASVDFPSTDFATHAREIFDIFQMCLKLKDQATISKEIQIMKEDILLLKTKISEIERRLKLDRSGSMNKKKYMAMAEAYRQELASYPEELLV